MKSLSTILFTAAIALRAPAQSMKLEPLPIALPKPLFEGTPFPPNVPNLEKPSNKLRPPFLAPAGTVNLALHKPVSSSDSDPVIGTLEMITDGNKAGTDGTYVELKPGVQNVVIDLEARCTIYALAIWHFHKEARAYAGVVCRPRTTRTSSPTCRRCSTTTSTTKPAAKSARTSVPWKPTKVGSSMPGA